MRLESDHLPPPHAITTPDAELLGFGAYVLDCRSLELWHDGRRLTLRPQPCRVLSMLAARAGELVSREELTAALWSDGTFVRFDLGLNSCVKQIRGALRQTGGDPQWIETLSRRGYRFVVPVRPLRGPARHFRVAGGHS